jgi:hypothetical protein
MKPFTLFIAGNPGGYFAQQKKRGAEQLFEPRGDAHVEQRSALCPAKKRRIPLARTGGHIATVR